MQVVSFFFLDNVQGLSILFPGHRRRLTNLVSVHAGGK
jgi:hypothetical protein